MTLSLAVALAAGSLAAPVAADFKAGMKAFERGEWVLARDAWGESASAGDFRSQYGLGVLYNEGKGVDVDFAEAAAWFRKAARQDFADAQVELGFLRALGKEGVTQDAVQAYVWFFLAAENGRREAEKFRDAVGEKLTPDEHAEANRRIADWQVGVRATD